jgi:hypothetical protein
MKFKIPKIKLDFSHIFQDLVVIGIAAGIAGFLLWKGFTKLGIMSYNGLTEQQVAEKYQRFQQAYIVFSKVGGHNPLLGGYFERGVAFPKMGGMPYYFHYSNDGKGHADFQMYVELNETWSTDPGLLGIGKYFTQNVIV